MFLNFIITVGLMLVLLISKLDRVIIVADISAIAGESFYKPMTNLVNR